MVTQMTRRGTPVKKVGKHYEFFLLIMYGICVIKNVSNNADKLIFYELKEPLQILAGISKQTIQN